MSGYCDRGLAAALLGAVLGLGVGVFLGQGFLSDLLAVSAGLVTGSMVNLIALRSAARGQLEAPVVAFSVGHRRLRPLFLIWLTAMVFLHAAVGHGPGGPVGAAFEPGLVGLLSGTFAWLAVTGVALGNPRDSGPGPKP